jgi:hypothetical protein
MCGLYKLLSEFFFEVGGLAVDLQMFEVFVEFELIEFLLLELLECVLDVGFGGVGVEFVGVVGLQFHLNLNYVMEKGYRSGVGLVFRLLIVVKFSSMLLSIKDRADGGGGVEVFHVQGRGEADGGGGL